MNARDQGNRGSCVAFSISGIKGCIANYLLSPEYAYLATVHQSPNWQPNQGLHIQTAITATAAGLPEEHYFPYQQDEPIHPLPVLPTGLSLHGPHMALIPPDLALVKTWLGAGKPVGVLLSLTKSFMTPIDGKVAFETGVFPGRHAVTVVGYGIDQSGHEHYLICNSWGSTWGVNGHAWLPDSYINCHASCIYGAN
ncbi:C1 family peptidase [Pseudomonas sp. SHC52]|uniref:C1 family peptidase n=1 Tax=Pseudomonas sp. SHC52 TaxID=984195 RepID=UPI002109F6C2|nr:C1 family peptidase [Pseudomonas sp. SHC52]